MAWTAPFTAVAGSVFTASQFNTFIRDNLSETLPAKALTTNSYFVTADTGSVAERRPVAALVDTSSSESYTSTDQTSYSDLTTSAVTTALKGPELIVNTGRAALVTVWAQTAITSVAAASVRMSYEVSGDTSIEASDQWATGKVGGSTDLGRFGCRTSLRTDLTPGLNTFTAKYRVSSGTGGFQYRRLIILPL